MTPIHAATPIAVFLDRDGTINYDPGYLSDPERLMLLPGASAAIARLNSEAVKTVVVSNQSGIGRGLFTEATLGEVHDRLRTLLRDESGATLDAIYYCSHRPDEDCDCRKPRQGLLMQAVDDLAVDLGRSYFIGDRASDILLTDTPGLKGILVRTGSDPDEELRLLQSKGVYPHHIAENIGSAVDWVIADMRNHAHIS